MEFIYEYGLFLAQAVTLVIAILVVATVLVGLGMKQKHDDEGHIEIRHLNEKYRQIGDSIAHVIAGSATRDGTVRATRLSLLTLFLVACRGGDRAVLHHDLLEDLPGLEKNVETRPRTTRPSLETKPLSGFFPITVSAS